MEDSRPERLGEARLQESGIEGRGAGRFGQNREHDDAADELRDPEILRHAEDDLADLLAPVGEIAPFGQHHEGTEGHVADAADLDQGQDDDLAEQTEPVAGADGRETGRREGGSGGKQGVEGRNRRRSPAERERQQHPPRQNIGQIAQSHHPDGMETVNEPAKALPHFFHVFLLFPCWNGIWIT